MVSGELQQQAGWGAPQPHPKLYPHHPLARRKRQRHLHVRCHPQAGGHCGRGADGSRPPRVAVTHRLLQASHAMAPKTTSTKVARAGQVLWLAAPYTGVAVGWLAQVYHLQVKDSEAAMNYTITLLLCPRDCWPSLWSVWQGVCPLVTPTLGLSSLAPHKYSLGTNQGSKETLIVYLISSL